MKPVYHIVSHSHWDREWYKSFEQFRSMLVNMVDDLLDLLARDPAYVCFTLDGQTVVLDDYLKVRPEREPEIRQRVAEGRLVIGPWYVLPDEFLVSGEATVRNLLVGTRRARDFGGEMKVGYIPDSFGHIAMMPAILRGFDIDTALLYRGFGGEPDQRSSEYWWTAPDGSRCLLVHLFRHGYSAGYFHQETDAQIVERFKGLKDEIDARATTSNRLLMNGGDHHWPDPKLPETLNLLRRNFEGEFVHSTVPRYVAAVKKEVDRLPEIGGELRFGYRYAFVVIGGVYSSRMYLKQQNWDKEMLLQRYVEPLNALASAAGMRSQLPLVRHAWLTLMQNHPHDSICGCSIDPVHREMMTRFKAVEDIGGSVVNLALQHLIPYDDQAAGDDRCLFFFNPSPFARSDVARAELNFYLQDIVVGLNPDVKVAPRKPPVSGFTLLDEDGREVPFQVTGRREGYDITYTNYNYPKQTYADKFSILVDARDVPPLGFKGLRVEARKSFPKFKSTLKAGRNFIENAHMRVEVNARGEVTMKDKSTGQVFPKLLVFEDSGDVGDEYNYSYPRKDRWIYSNKGHAKVVLSERGPLHAALTVTTALAVPASAGDDANSRSRKTVKLPVASVLRLTPDSRYLEIETTVDNTARDHRLRVLFPSGIRTDMAYADSQFCVVERKQQEYDVKQFTIEHPAKVAPMQRFVTIRNAKRALTLFAYGLPEYELKLDGKRTLALTLLRCVGLLAADKPATRPGGKAGWHNETPDAQCPGQHTFRYALMPHAGAECEQMEHVNRQSEHFHLPLLPVTRKTPAMMPFSRAGLSIAPDSLVLSAFKQAETGSNLILRVYNPTAAEVQGTIRSESTIRKAAAALLNEEETGPLDVRDEHAIAVRVPARGIVSVSLALK